MDPLEAEEMFNFADKDRDGRLVVKIDIPSKIILQSKASFLKGWNLFEIFW